MTSTNDYLGIDLGSMKIKTTICNTSGKDITFNNVGDSHGSHDMPAVVAISINEEDDNDKENKSSSTMKYSCIIGDCATHYLTISPKNVLTQTNSMIGLSFYSETVQNICQNLPYELEPKFHTDRKKDTTNKFDYNSNMVTVVVKEKEKFIFDPEKIASLFLETARRNARKTIQKEFGKIVITVPADAGFVQREAYKRAAKLAGFKNIELLSEPAAVAINYLFRRRTEDSNSEKGVKVYLIIDFGGSSTKVSLVKMENNVFTIMASAKSDYMSSNQITEYIIESAVEHINNHNKLNMDFESIRFSNQGQEIYSGAEELKTKEGDQTMTINFSNENRTENLSVQLKKRDIEESVQKTYDDLEELIDKVLEKAVVSRFDNVILAGAASRNPLIQKIISDLTNKEPYCFKEPYAAISEGASIYNASIGMSSPIPGLNEPIQVIERVPVRINVAVARGRLVKMVSSATKYPYESEEVVFTHYGKPSAFDIRLFEGRSMLRRECVPVSGCHTSGKETVRIKIRQEGPNSQPKIFAGVDGKTMSQVALECANFDAVSSADMEWFKKVLPPIGTK